MKKEFVEVKREELLGKVKELMDAGARLAMIAGADRGDVVEALYFFDVGDHMTTLRVPLKSDDKVVQSITDLSPAANLYERELAEMFGVEIKGHPSPGRLYTSEDYSGEPPLLKKTPGGSFD